MERLKALVQYAMKRRQVLIDEEQLGLNDDILDIIQRINRSVSTKSATKVFTETAIEWKSLKDDYKECAISEFETACSSGAQCPSMKRTLFISELFTKHFLKPMIYANVTDVSMSKVNYIELFVNCLSGYTVVQFIDDVHHIRSMHDEGHNAVECKIDETERECVGSLMRKFMERKCADNAIDDDSEQELNLFDQFMNGLDDRERMIMEISAKMHHALSHQHDGEKEIDDDDLNEDEKQYKVRSLQWWKKRMQSQPHGANKFVNEVSLQHKASDQAKQRRMDELGGMLTKLGFDSECTSFCSFLVENKYDSETVLDDLMDEEDAFNEYPESNLFQVLNENKFLAKSIKKHLGGGKNDDDILAEFSFGGFFYHWPYFKERSNYNTARYDNIKQECINNRIHSISLQQFTNLLTKALLYRESQKGRSIQASQGAVDNNKYDIPHRLPLSVSHIVVLLMYCNYTELQNKYKKLGCRSSKINNAEIGHWYRLIFEAVLFFGSKVRPKNVFFTGLNTRLCFTTFAPTWSSPFSTTVSLDVAKRFMDGEGIIIKLRPTSGANDVFFDVEWLSAHDHERERLFVHASGLQIIDIRFIENGQLAKNGAYLRAFTLLSTLLSGQFICNLLRKQRGQQRAESALLDLIAVYEENNNIGMKRGIKAKKAAASISLYVQQLFFNMLRGLKTEHQHFVIKSEFDKLNDDLKAELFELEETVQSENRYQITLSPFLGTLCKATNIQFLDECIWVVDEKQVNNLKQGQEVHSHEFTYSVINEESITFMFRLDPNLNEDALNLALWLNIVDCPHSVFDARVAVRVDDLDWQNTVSHFQEMNKGQSSGIWIFEIALLERLQSFSMRIACDFDD